MFKNPPSLGIAGFVALLLVSNTQGQSPTYPQTAQPYRYTTPVNPAAQHPPVVPSAELDAALTAKPVDPFTIDSNGVISFNTKPASLKPPAVKPAMAAPTKTQTAVVEQSPVEPVGYIDSDSISACDCSPSGPCKSTCLSCRDQPSCCANKSSTCSIGGWIQQGFTGNFSSPSNRSNGTVLFNDRANDYRLNQLYLFAERSVVPNRSDWDFGGRIDLLFGSDARYVTVPGLERHKDRTRKWNSESQDYGFAIPQAYVEVAAPWQNGVSLKAGHFYSIAGYETVAAPENFFYSHAYTFLYGEPFTHTGALLSGQRNKQLQWQLGYTNGWDVFDSLSDEYGVLAGLTISSADQRTSVSTTVHSGKDVTSARVGGELVDGDRHFYSLVLQHKINKSWRYVFQHDFGYQQGGQLVVNTTPNTITSDTAKWYGINQYLIHDINDQMSSALRVEWFRDQDHSRIGIPVRFNPGGSTFNGGNYVALTSGLNWRPQSNLTIRPELRWDYSDLKGNASAPGGDPSFRAFDDNTSSSQVTAALDVTLLF